MTKVAVGFDEDDLKELTEIIMDKDTDSAFKFLKDRVYSQVMKKEKSKLDVQGKTHL